MKIVTDTYCNSAAECGRKAVFDFLERWWWAFAIPILCALVAAMWDLRWLVAALALALVAYPFALMMAYYTRALTPEAVKAMQKRRLEISDGGIEIIYEPFGENSLAPKPERIALEVISCVEDRGDSLLLRFAGKELAIPISVLDDGRASDLLSFFASKGIALA